MSAALRELGRVAHERGGYERARECYEESLSLGREQGDLRRVALALLFLGLLALEQGFLPAARTQLRESLVVSQRAGLRVGFAPALDLLACLAAMDSRPVMALRLAGAAASMIGALDHQAAHVRRGGRRERNPTRAATLADSRAAGSAHRGPASGRRSWACGAIGNFCVLAEATSPDGSRLMPLMRRRSLIERPERHRAA